MTHKTRIASEHAGGLDPVGELLVVLREGAGVHDVAGVDAERTGERE